jgi:hypothetical protein
MKKFDEPRPMELLLVEDRRGYCVSESGIEVV